MSRMQKRADALKREKLKAKVALMKRMGYNTFEIAEALKLTTGEVTTLYGGVVAEYRAQRFLDREAIVQEKLHTLADVRKEAWEALQASKGELVKTIQETVTRADGETFEKFARHLQARLAGSEYMDVILRTIDQERKLLGLDQADKIDVNVHGKIDWEMVLFGPTPRRVDPLQAAIESTHQPPPSLPEIPPGAPEGGPDKGENEEDFPS